MKNNPQRNRERTRAWFTNKRKLGRCLHCEKPKTPENATCADCRKKRREKLAGIKLEVLINYSPNKILGCCWPGCEVNDIDMLSLDHIDNSGHLEKYTGSYVHQRVKREGFPEGYQTLCFNHQIKKEILRVRDLNGEKKA